jgi:hypothetical protein
MSQVDIRVPAAATSGEVLPLSHVGENRASFYKPRAVLASTAPRNGTPPQVRRPFIPTTASHVSLQRQGAHTE